MLLKNTLNKWLRRQVTLLYRHELTARRPYYLTTTECKNMVESPGFEPGIAESKSGVIPFHYASKYWWAPSESNRQSLRDRL